MPIYAWNTGNKGFKTKYRRGKIDEFHDLSCIL